MYGDLREAPRDFCDDGVVRDRLCGIRVGVNEQNLGHFCFLGCVCNGTYCALFPFRAGRRLSRAGFSCLCCPSEFSAGPDGRLLRDECRHRVFLLDGGEVGPDGRGHSLTTDENRPSMKKEL